jgi:hypothetical protein
VRRICGFLLGPTRTAFAERSPVGALLNCVLDLEIKRRLPKGLVFGQDNLLGFLAAARAQARALAVRSIDAIEGSSTGDEEVTVLHTVVLATVMMNEVERYEP